MLEKIYSYAKEDATIIEKLIDDDPLMINHMVLNKGDSLPEHFSNSNVYMVVIRGTLTLKLDDQEPHVYTHGQIINIPFNIKMNVGNSHEETLEFFVCKAPSPRLYGK